MELKAFDELFAVNVNGHTEKKKTGNTELTYLSWPFAWAEIKKRFPDAQYEIEKFEGLPYVYDPQTGYMVYTTVTIEGITHEMWLPVMDGANNAMKAEPYTYSVKEYKYGKWTGNYVDKTVSAATMMDINKTMMRCLVKNLAMFGLGLYIYAGEDLPITEEDEKKAKPKKEDVPTSPANLQPILPETPSPEMNEPIVSEEEMAKPIDAAAWRGLQRELKEAGLDPQKVLDFYQIDKPSAITWDMLGRIRSEKKFISTLDELKTEVA